MEVILNRSGFSGSQPHIPIGAGLLASNANDGMSRVKDELEFAVGD